MRTKIYSGWIFIDKPEGKTSFDVIRDVKKILHIKKVGHCGTLDPIASGILGIAIGEATKSIPFFSKRKASFKNLPSLPITGLDPII